MRVRPITRLLPMSNNTKHSTLVVKNDTTRYKDNKKVYATYYIIHILIGNVQYITCINNEAKTGWCI
jgi:hypothetical protein